MASANVDLARSIFAAFERGDYSSAEWAHAEIELVIADGPDPGRWSGLAGMAEGWRRWLESWEGFRGEVDEVRALDDERVLVLQRRNGRPRQAGWTSGSFRPKARAYSTSTKAR